MPKSYILGTKYQTFENDESKVYRLFKIRNANSLALIDDNKVLKMVSSEAILNDYIEITPDAFLNIMITDLANYPDLYVCVNKSSDLVIGNNTPALILRARAYSSQNAFLNGGLGSIMLGDCTSVAIDNTYDAIKDIFEFENIDDSYSYALYVDDDLQSIESVLSNKCKTRVCDVLASIKATCDKAEADADNNIEFLGIESNLTDMLLEHEFIRHYRAIFNILQLYQEVIDPEDKTDDGNIILPKDIKKYIEDTIHKYISNVKVLQYEKDIDVSKIVAFKHIVISDANQKIYFIAYEEVGDYPVDEDILKAMNSVKS